MKRRGVGGRVFWMFVVLSGCFGQADVVGVFAAGCGNSGVSSSDYSRAGTRVRRGSEKKSLTWKRGTPGKLTCGCNFYSFAREGNIRSYSDKNSLKT